jgi:hypothetical protein
LGELDTQSQHTQQDIDSQILENAKHYEVWKNYFHYH